MTWDTLLEQGRKRLLDNLEEAPRRRARKRWLKLLDDAKLVGVQLPYAIPPDGHPPRGFTETTSSWELGWRTPLDSQVVIRVLMTEMNGQWEPTRQYGNWGIPGDFLVPTFHLVSVGDAHWIEWEAREKWMYAADLATAAAYAELSWKNLCSLREIQSQDERN